MSDKTCAFCGHHDYMHRVVDAILERIAAGETRAAVLDDYGYSEAEFERVRDRVKGLL